MKRIAESLAVAGFVSFSAGWWLIHPPLALIIGGAILATIGLWGLHLWAFSRPSSTDAPK